MTRRKRVVLWMVAGFMGLYAVHLGWIALTASDWRTASREPVGLAPDPAAVTEAVVQVYAARAWGWRGYFGVHSWLAVKPTGAPAFTVYEVIGWRAPLGRLRPHDPSARRRRPLVRPSAGAPGRRAGRRGGPAHRAHRPGRSHLSVRHPATDCGRDRTRTRSSPSSGARSRSSGSTCRRPRSARTIWTATSSPLPRAAGSRCRSTGSRASSRGRRRGSRSICSDSCSASTCGPPRSSSPSSDGSDGAVPRHKACPDRAGRHCRRGTIPVPGR